MNCTVCCAVLEHLCDTTETSISFLTLPTCTKAMGCRHEVLLTYLLCIIL